MPRSPGHGPDFETRRQEIIDKAAALFVKKGYAATGIAEVGDVAGLGRGALLPVRCGSVSSGGMADCAS
ncbi:TetR/AcrR family transcriptional regulator [Streptomyces sp. NPDC050549]|uniref:TetR/AcrR family transcriptional regulator n=1 Tax=Streptomyces sp. NPDC050549 TaxID=3155406 RepID=UPI003437C671